MTVTTTSTFIDVMSAFVDGVADEVGEVQVSHLWPGPNSKPKMVFFTTIDWIVTEDAHIKVGRRNRNEEYEANFEVWNLVPSSSPTTGDTALDEAKAIYDICEDVVVRADSPVRDVAGVVNVVCQPLRVEPLAFEKGWAVVLTARLSVTARLT